VIGAMGPERLSFLIFGCDLCMFRKNGEKECPNAFAIMSQPRNAPLDRSRPLRVLFRDGVGQGLFSLAPLR